MGLATPPNAILQPNVGQLVATPEDVVSPRAVSTMVEAFRSGQISANDILDRASERARLKEKADVMALREQMAPEAQQARALALQAASQRAKQAMDDAALEAYHKKTLLEQDALAKQVGPIVSAAFASVGKPIPTVESSNPELKGVKVADLRKIDEEMPWISQYAYARQKKDQESKQWELKEFLVDTAKGPQPVTKAWNKVTGEVRPTMPELTMPTYDAWVVGQKPGTVQVAPQVVPAAQPAQPMLPTLPLATGEDPAALRAQLANKGVDPATISQMSDGQVKAALQGPATAPTSVVQPAQPTAPRLGDVMPSGSFVPGVGLVTGPPKQPENAPAIQFLATRYQTNDTVKGLNAANEAYKAVQDVLPNIQPDGSYAKGVKFLPKQGDYKMMVAYAKILDPNSVVREGEITLLEGTKSSWQRLSAAIGDRQFSEYINTILGKQMFTPQERISFKSLLDGSYENRIKAVQPIYDANVAAARALGADESQIPALFPFFPGTAGTGTPTGPTPPPGFVPLPTRPGQYWNPKTGQGWKP